ncbi:xylan 1,4-beta-xylosidase [Streptomyces botrytidirepellens]|uniref:Xylan 1,4-beta-xylosidase n=1 Tax=Streptomyces botrytidirepellens TaxID=2486417 RepID=A0A3M8W1M4_9ACTN|nr:xylan 1,4-beta-xylosidase [Streptomyces botrytidirepellens]RNG22561.1 xylan 1,4-beta-xylosidase [Streptomyces botrytidirepellens]
MPVGSRAGLPGARRWRITALLAIGMGTLALLLTTCTSWPGDGAGRPGASASARERAASAGLGWGFTHTQYSADRGTDSGRKAAESLLSDRPMPQNQHIMGWGAGNPEPSPGRYDFADLDRRVALMRTTGTEPVLTLCCAPDWMKGGTPGDTDWSQESLETAPTPDHYEDFAKLAGKVADRYPEVRHFIVWNEFKGFYDDGKNRWNYEGYTKLYNLVYDELKKRNPKNLVGGPYVVADSDPPGAAGGDATVSGPWGTLDRRSADAITYWNEHKAGADFVVVDGSSYTREGDRLIPDAFGATQKFEDVTRWLDATTKLPVWWAEWYVEPAADTSREGARGRWSEAHRVAVQATALTRLARGGAATAFYWNPETTDADCPGCLWRPTELDDGGSALPMMELLSRFGREFPPGTRFRSVDIAADDRPNVQVLADDDATLVVNTLARPIKAKVDGRSFAMDAYEVRWLKR